MVALNVKFLAVSLGRFCRCKDCVQKLIDTRVQIFHRKAAVLDRFHQLSCRAETRRRHLQIGASLYSRDMIVGAAPVGDYKSVKSPVAAQNILEKMHALIGILAVDLVIGCHDRTGLRLIDRQFKAGQVDLAQGALIHNSVHRHAALLLRVHCEMLDTGVYALALDSLYIGSRHLACQIRILRKIFEISSAERASLNIHTGTEQNIDAHRLGFFAQRDADFCAKVLVPTARHCRCGRKTCRRKRSVQAEVISCACLSS